MASGICDRVGGKPVGSKAGLISSTTLQFSPQFFMNAVMECSRGGQHVYIAYILNSIRSEMYSILLYSSTWWSSIAMLFHSKTSPATFTVSLFGNNSHIL